MCVYIYDVECTVKPVLSGHSNRKPKIGFQDRLSLNAGNAEVGPSLSCHLSLRSLFCIFLSALLRQVLLYIYLGIFYMSPLKQMPFLNFWKILNFTHALLTN